MRSATSGTFQQWQELATNGQMHGRDRPVGRVTLSDNALITLQSDRAGPWRQLQHRIASDLHERELEAVQSIAISRDLGNDTASCTITFSNNDPNYRQPDGVDTLGRPGWVTPTRGETSPIHRPSVYNGYLDPGQEPYLTEWGYEQNAWHNALLPNRLLRTYQGYGSDNFDQYNQYLNFRDPAFVPAWLDTKLVITGTWLIDTVSMSVDGKIVVQCRDLGKLLLEQLCYPPMLPLSRFPLVYCPAIPPRAASGGVIGTNVIRSHSAAHELHMPRLFANGIFGHNTADAFDGRPGTYYLGHGYPSGNSDYFKEWIQGSCGGNKVNKISMNIVKTGYFMYVSVMEHGAWQGGSVIPYSHGSSHDHHANIPYVMTLPIGAEQVTFDLPRTYDADMIRFTFSNMQPFNLGFDGQAGSQYYPNRVGIREIQAGYAEPYNPAVVGTVGQPGSISDWSEAIKELVGWAGFTAPVDRTPRGDQLTGTLLPADPLLGTAIDGVPLRVWGDFEVLGAGPILCTLGDYFLNKTFMECCKLISDFLGCVFFVDEWGGIVFRFPNLFSGGNFITDPTAPGSEGPYKKREWPIEFHEEVNLLGYTVVLDDSQLRSEVVVVGTNPDVTTNQPLAAGTVLSSVSTITGTSTVSGAIDFTSVLGGQTRMFMVPGDATKLFYTKLECQRMAELIGIKLLFSYRKGSAQILGHPGLQLDDQVRIFERVTNEYNVHYVSAISSNMDLVSGAYTMDVTTYWLGTDPDTDWFLKADGLTPAVRDLPGILDRLGTTGYASAPAP